MASEVYSNGVEQILDGVIDLDTDTIKLALIKSAHTEDSDHDFVADISGDECDATGYTGGFNGADRLTTTVTTTEQTASDRVVCILQDKTWTAIGGASNNTLEAVLVLFEVTSDADSFPIAYLLFSGTLTTNGSDILVDMDGTDGNIRWTV